MVPSSLQLCDAFKLFMAPPDMSLPDAALARIRDGLTDLPGGVLDLVCGTPPSLSMYWCSCRHVANLMAATVDDASVRARAESVLSSALMIPPVLAAIVGGYVAAFKVSSFARAAAIRQAPLSLEHIHAQRHTASCHLEHVKDDAHGCDFCGDCSTCREQYILEDRISDLDSEHKAACVRLTTTLMAPL
jgi:hypothetical protein